jgi:hypothetical protein
MTAQEGAGAFGQIDGEAWPALGGDPGAIAPEAGKIDCVSAGIRLAQRVVVNIRIPVQHLGIPRLGHDGIRLQEAAQRGIIEARPVVIGLVPSPTAGRYRGSPRGRPYP